MLALLARFLTSPGGAAAVAGGGVFVAMILFSTLPLTRKLAECEGERAALEQAVGALREAHARMEAAIGKQNEAIVALGGKCVRENAAATDRARRELQRAAPAMGTTPGEIDRWLASPPR